MTSTEPDAAPSPEPVEMPGSAGLSPAEAPPEPSAPAAEDAAPVATTAAAPDLSPAATGARRAALFPALFVGPDGKGTWRPIKLRIHADIQARAPGEFSKRALGIFFSRYTTTTAYLKALAAPGAQRHDLDGQPAGEIAEEHRAAAAEEVARRGAIAAQRRALFRKRAPRAPSSAPSGADAPERTRDDAPRSEGSRTDAPARRDTRPPTPQAEPEGRAGAPLPADPAQRERALLLRAFESSPLSKANFCALKRISEAELDAQLAQAREERGGRKR
jgi:sRNA-binding protein